MLCDLCSLEPRCVHLRDCTLGGFFTIVKRETSVIPSLFSFGLSLLFFFLEREATLKEEIYLPREQVCLPFRNRPLLTAD